MAKNSNQDQPQDQPQDQQPPEDQPPVPPAETVSQGSPMGAVEADAPGPAPEGRIVYLVNGRYVDPDGNPV